MSGLGRDWPAGTVSDWPRSLVGGGPPPTNGLPFPSHSSLYEAIRNHHTTSPPNTNPAYSNTGTALLGMALVAANKAALEPDGPSTYAELVKRDIFEPLGMNDSHFLATDANKHLVVVPSKAPEVAVSAFYRLCFCTLTIRTHPEGPRLSRRNESGSGTILFSI